jgi:hypothetical protein
LRDADANADLFAKHVMERLGRSSTALGDQASQSPDRHF